ncbi:MAG TPA: sigma-54 dependent transcriptional regulator [Candidatus Binatia bacterium]|nr:sigma-54 dependent transcriptional regulator [Candidatus Binatia bacterium]
MRGALVMLAVADEALVRGLRASLLRHRCEVLWTRQAGPAPLAGAPRSPDVVVVEARRGATGDGIETARRLRRTHPALRVVLVTGQGSEALAVAALRAGIDDYFADPLDPEEVAAAVLRLAGAVPPAEAPLPGAAEGALVGPSAALERVRRAASRIGPAESTALVTGETGTGKELVAHLVHALSPRSPRRMVSVNCAAIPDTLLESELFGHERGAFTGAEAARDGALGQANGGTVFLDEVGDLSPLAQAKLLRVVETREVSRLGGRGRIPLDFRIIAATNQDLDRALAEGRFRRDLYFRLNVTRIHVPPLRERREDVAPLLAHFFGAFGRRLGVGVPVLDEDLMARLLSYDWPGNVRELRNLAEAICVSGPPGRVSLSDLPDGAGLAAAAGATASELAQLLHALNSTRWNKSRAAERLHWSRVTLYRKMAKYHLTTPAAAGPSHSPSAP